MCKSHKHTGAKASGRTLRPGATFEEVESDVQRIESSVSGILEPIRKRVGELLVRTGSRLLGQ